jgi:hypothetical protein
MAFGLILPMLVSSIGQADIAKLVTHKGSDGTTYFALSLPVEKQIAASASRDVVVLIDTSASQTGAYRNDQIEALDSLLATLGPNDRVNLQAIDLKAVPLSDGFVAPHSDAARAAVKKLIDRAPLGSTDLVAGLTSTVGLLKRDPSVARHIVYIGDGISRGDIPSADQFEALVDQLVASRATVSSYAIGPQRDIHLLAALANNTGGQVYVDAEDISGQQAGAAIGKAIGLPVFWPTNGSAKQMGEVFPSRLVPLRGDRDGVLIGALAGDVPASLSIDGTVNGGPMTLQWNVTAQDGADDYAFLSRLVEMARRDQGVTLPTLGTESLREIRRLIVAGAEDLTKLSQQTLAAGNAAGAALLAEEAMRRDPANTTAEALQRAAKRTTTRNAQVVETPVAQATPFSGPRSGCCHAGRGRCCRSVASGRGELTERGGRTAPRDRTDRANRGDPGDCRRQGDHTPGT